MNALTKPLVRKLRCAVYTRKSSEEGLEQEFNSLHAQREACEAYIASQRSEGWVLVRDQYDDGGISGGTSGGTSGGAQARWIVLDAFGGRRDLAVVGRNGRIELAASAELAPAT